MKTVCIYIYDEEENEISRLTFHDQPQDRQWPATPTLCSQPFFGL